MVSINDLNKSITWSNKRSVRKFLETVSKCPDESQIIRSHAGDLLLRVKLQAALEHAWHYPKGGRRLEAIEEVLHEQQADHSKTKLKKICHKIGFNLKTGEVCGYDLAHNIKRPKSRIHKDEAKAFELVRLCLVCAH